MLFWIFLALGIFFFGQFMAIIFEVLFTGIFAFVAWLLGRKTEVPFDPKVAVGEPPPAPRKE